jgi:exopolysaccharide production protein ExoQ
MNYAANDGTGYLAGREELRTSTGSGMAFFAGFFFAFRMVIVLVSVRILGMEARTGSELSMVAELLLLAAVCFHSLGAGGSSRPTVVSHESIGSLNSMSSMIGLPAIRWALVFLLFSCCSFAWSITVSLPASFAYWCGMAADVAIVMVLLSNGSVTGVSHAVMKGYIWSACCLSFIVWIMPVQPDLRLGDMDYFNTNQIGNLCAFAILMAQYLMSKKDGRWGFVTLFFILTLLRSLSKTTLAAFLLSEAILVIRDGAISLRTKLFLILAAILTILVFWGLFEAYYDVYTTAGNQAETLTGRTAIWAFALEGALQRPWIGNGFDAMWKVMPPFGPDQFEARHAENELLQQFYAYGAAGIVMLIGIYGSLYSKIRKMQRGSSQMIFFSILLFVVIRGLAEAEPFDLLLPLWAVVLFSMLIAYESKADGETALIQPEPHSSPFPSPQSVERC